MTESPMFVDGLAVRLEVCVNVRDKERAKRWYADKLGICFDEMDRATVAGVTLVLWGFPDATPASHVVYQFVTPNLEQARKTLLERGVSVGEIDRDSWNFVFRDPDGNLLVFYAPRKWLASGMAPYPA